MRIPGAVLFGAEALVLGVLALEAYVMWPLYAARRRAGDGRRAAGTAQAGGKAAAGGAAQAGGTAAAGGR
ncbi:MULTISPECIES: hypothetical protein [unclassified Streptomyces]|uniref:hypothetical protein n=1 Tax=Streptomyces TaxID=1883 RepID=UPI0015C4AAAA|nr:hypothetical protein [Streptomyces sp. CB04723]QLG30209.1 hypothetical protein HXS80_26630 [Streptomyces sp. CB04723]